MHHQFETECVHSGYDLASAKANSNSLSVPIYATSTFLFDTCQDMADAFSGAKPAHIYSRLTNPTTTVAEQRIACLDRAEAAVITASGIGAITSFIWSHCRAGDHVLAAKHIYGCTYAYLSHILPRFGVAVDFVDMCDLDAVKAALKDNTAIVFFESVANPTCTVADIRAISDLAHARRAECLVAVDNTFATPAMCRPLELGADVVIYSLTKGMIGSGTALAGAVVGKADMVATTRLVGVKDCTGSVADAHVSHAILNGLKTLDVRMQRHSDNARALTKFLLTKKGHGIDVVHSTVLSEVWRREAVNDRDCLVVAFELATGLEGAKAFMDALQVIRRAVSLGDAESLCCAPAVSTHSPYSPEERAKYGIADGLVRISCGIENAEDIIEDVKQALKAAGVQ